MHDIFHDHSPMWFQFNHGRPKSPPEDEPYNTPFAVLGYTEAGEPVFTIHTVEGETEEVNVKDKIIILKNTTYTITAEGTNLVLTDSDGNVQTVPVFESAEATTEQAGFMSAADKAKLDGIQANAQANPSIATATKNGLLSANDKAKLDGIEEGAQKNVEIPVASTTASGLMSATDKQKLDGLPTTVPTYDLATIENDGLMSAGYYAKLSNIEINAEVNTIEGITLNGTRVQPDSNRIVNLTVSGGGGGGGGDTNVIEIVKVNGTALTPDAEKAVDIDLSSYATTTAMNQAIATAIQGAMSSSY